MSHANALDRAAGIRAAAPGAGPHVLPVRGNRQARRDYQLIGATLGGSTVYATLRYNVFKGVPWSDWPHFVGDKILAVSSLVLFAAAVVRLARPAPRKIGRLMAAASALAVTHTLIALALFRPDYFDKFFAGAKLSLTGGVSVLMAAVAMALLNWGKGRAGSSAPKASALPIGAIAFLSGAHAGITSIGTWLQPASWPGSMPPITLLSFLVGATALTIAAKLARHG